MGYIQKISKLLKQKNLSKKEIAKRIGVSGNTMYSYMNRNSEMPVNTLIHIASELNVPVSYFFNEENNRNYNNYENSMHLEAKKISGNATAANETPPNYTKNTDNIEYIKNLEAKIEQYKNYYLKYSQIFVIIEISVSVATENTICPTLSQNFARLVVFFISSCSFCNVYTGHLNCSFSSSYILF
ncbi:MAG: helix-turn-helix transcriptional regulator [Bacteroidales bacterium]|nr:helix-turn-helix transcriptional regulator [Bacteroidales bacterium]